MSQRRARVRRRGFTLIEMMMVVVIIGIIGILAVSSYQRAGERKSSERQMAEIMAMTTKTRALAEMAGPYLGTPNFIQCITVNGAAGAGLGNDLFILYDRASNSVTYPTQVRLAPGPPTQMVSDCERVVLQPDVTMDLSNCNTLEMSFTQTGRAYIRPASGGNCNNPLQWIVGVCLTSEPGCRTGTANDSLPQAQPSSPIRILPSGVVCRARQKGQVLCDADA